MNYFNKLLQKLKAIDYKKTSKIIVPFLIAVLSGVTTYFLYSYFNRDIVRVQSVSVRPKEIELTVERQFASKLSKLLSESSLDRIQDRSIDLTSINKDYIIESIRNLQRRSSDLNDKIDLLTGAKNMLNEFTIDSLEKTDIEKINGLESYLYEDFFPLGATSGNKKKFTRQAIIVDVNNDITKLTKTKLEIDDVIQQLALKSKKTIEDNKDRFIIEIIAFNDGNQQTVIRNKGTLVLGQNQINLKRASFVKIEDYYSKLSKAMAGKYNQDGSNSNYIIIEPKSFIVMSLEIDKFNNKNRDIEVIKREYLSGQSRVGLILFDIENNPIEQYNFLLQNDIEIDPNDELSKYTSPYTSK